MKKLTYVTDDKNKRVWKCKWFAFFILIYPFNFLTRDQENHMKRGFRRVKLRIYYKKANLS